MQNLPPAGPGVFAAHRTIGAVARRFKSEDAFAALTMIAAELITTAADAHQRAQLLRLFDTSLRKNVREIEAVLQQPTKETERTDDKHS